MAELTVYSEMANLTIYAVFLDMENDTPDVYCLDEEVAKMLIAGNDAADYVELYVSTLDWMRERASIPCYVQSERQSNHVPRSD